ncbi:MAG: ATP-binding protein [Moorellales bacterium]
MPKRPIIHIDEEKCDGCGACLISCPEGALAIVDGKARLVKESYCDGLGACLGACPQGALTVEEREAQPYQGPPPGEEGHHAGVHPAEPPGACHPAEEDDFVPCCVGAAAPGPAQEGIRWPVQLRLLSPDAPHLRQADLLVAADCVAFIYPHFHHELAAGKALAVGCPKLDDAAAHRRKLRELVAQARPRRLTVAYMEVPCCHGLVRMVEEAVGASPIPIPLETVMVGLDGRIHGRRSYGKAITF